MIDFLGWATMVVAGLPPFMKNLTAMRVAMMCSGLIGGVYTTLLGSIPLTVLNAVAVGTGVYHLFMKPAYIAITRKGESQ